MRGADGCRQGGPGRWWAGGGRKAGRACILPGSGPGAGGKSCTKSWRPGGAYGRPPSRGLTTVGIRPGDPSRAEGSEMPRTRGRPGQALCQGTEEPGTWTVRTEDCHDASWYLLSCAVLGTDQGPLTPGKHCTPRLNGRAPLGSNSIRAGRRWPGGWHPASRLKSGRWRLCCPRVLPGVGPTRGSPADVTTPVGPSWPGPPGMAGL